MALRPTVGILALALLGLSSTACISRGFPTHSGGKRFHREQQLISVAIDEAVDAMDLDLISDAAVRGQGSPTDGEADGSGDGIGLVIFSMSDQGVGRSSLLGLLGDSQVESTSSELLSGADADDSGFGLVSSEDLDYLKGKIVQKVLSSGLRFDPDADDENILNSGAILVTVGELGIDESSFNALVVSSNRLVARVQLNAWYVRQPKGDDIIVTPLFSNEVEGHVHRSRYAEWYVFGIGPVNDTRPTFEAVERRD